MEMALQKFGALLDALFVSRSACDSALPALSAHAATALRIVLAALLS